MGYGRYSNPDIRARRFDLDKVRRLHDGGRLAAGPRRHLGKGRVSAFPWRWSTVSTPTPRAWWSSRRRPKRPASSCACRSSTRSAAYKKVIEKKHDVAWMGWSTSLRPQYWEHFHSDQRPQAPDQQHHQHRRPGDGPTDRRLPAVPGRGRAHRHSPVRSRTKSTRSEPSSPPSWCPMSARPTGAGGACPGPAGTKHSGDLFDPFSSTTGGLFWFDKDLRCGNPKRP